MGNHSQNSRSVSRDSYTEPLE